MEITKSDLRIIGISSLVGGTFVGALSGGICTSVIGTVDVIGCATLYAFRAPFLGQEKALELAEPVSTSHSCLPVFAEWAVTGVALGP